MAAAEDSTIFVSEDHGTNWSSITVNAPFRLTYLDGSAARGEAGFSMTTSDGTNWVYSLPAIGFLTGVGHGNGRYVVLGGTVRLVSQDLEEWSAVPVPYSHNSVVFGNGILVSVGAGSGTGGIGFISTSVDGSRWIDRTSPTMVDLNSVTYAQGKFVAVGSLGKIVISTNGVDWFERTPAATGSALRGVAYGNGRFTAIGDSSLLRHSTDGETWVTTGSSGTTLNAVTFANGIFVAVGNSGAVRSSVDGISWTTRSTSPSHSRALRAVRYAGDRFVAVGDQDGSGEGAVVAHSTNGTNWTKEVANVAFALQAAVAAAGNYVAVGASGTLVSAPFQDAESPVITGQPNPANQTVSAGATVTYTVTVLGAGLQYRWLKDGTPLADGPGISGSATGSLTLIGVDVLDTGTYQVSAWNDAASVLSQPVSLFVNGPPIITLHPVSLTISNLQTTNFTVAAVGPGSLGFQWRRDGQPLANAGTYSGVSTDRLTISGATGTNEGSYDVIATNAFGASQPSSPAQLTINRPPTLLQPPAATNLAQGQTFTLSIVAEGSPTLTYQWKRDGVNLTDGGRVAGATTATLTITGALVGDRGSYTVAVSNSFNPGVVSAAAYLSVLGPGALLPQFTYNGSGTIFDIAPTADGNFLIGGGNLSVSGKTWTGLTKVDSNGVPVGTFATTNAARIPNSTVRSIAVQPDGQLLVGGGFWQWGGDSQFGYLVRLDADGVLDTTYKPAPGLTVTRVISQAAGKALTARTGFGAGAQSYFTRYDATGAKDSGFTEVFTATAGQINSMVTQTDGKIWASMLAGLKRANADGTSPGIVTTYNPVAGISFVHVGPDNKIYYSDNNGQYFGRLNADGSQDTGFNVTINGSVADMAFLANGDIVIVGSFFTVNAATSAYIAVLDPAGASVGGFLSPYTWASGGSLYSIELLGDGSALVGGNVVMTLPSAQRSVQRVQILPPAGTASPTFAEWKADKGLPPGQDGPGDDPDGDGLSNIAEFAFGTHPNQSQSRVLPANRVHSENGESYPAVSFVRRKDLTGATVVVDAFTSLPFGSPSGTTQVGQPEDLGDGTERIVLRAQTPLRSLQGFYFRTRVLVP